MNIQQFNLACSVCSDKRRFELNENDLDVRIRKLQDILNRHKINDEEYSEFLKKEGRNYLLLINHDRIHNHFMCGKCLRANTSLFEAKENHLKKLICKLFFLVYKEANYEVCHNTLRIIQGDYPIICDGLRRLWYSRKRGV